jgi:hypothetical protein
MSTSQPHPFPDGVASPINKRAWAPRGPKPESVRWEEVNAVEVT